MSAITAISGSVLSLFIRGKFLFFSVSPRLPGDLDDEGKLTLVRRLIREGLVVVLAP
jgi:hypothetical protein